MRLNPEQVTVILDTVHKLCGLTAQVSLYGSRLDDSRRGGDVDLLIEAPSSLGLLIRARIKNRLEQQLQLPVDVLVSVSTAPLSAFVAMVKPQAQRLTSLPSEV